MCQKKESNPDSVQIRHDGTVIRPSSPQIIIGEHQKKFSREQITDSAISPPEKAPVKPKE